MRDMTKGSIGRHMLQFTIPLLLSNVFQQLYIVTSTVIVGQFLGKEALAAVGTSGAIMNILLFLIVGITLGASILIAQYYGAGEYGLVKKEMGTALTAGLLFTLALIVLGLLCARSALKLLQTPAEIMPQAMQYLELMLVGLIFTFFYNMFSSSLRALGEAKAPVIFLLFSTLVNIVLVVYFINSLQLGVAGAALATVISQALAAGLCLLYIWAKIPQLQLSWQDLKIAPALLGQTVQYSGIYAVQQCVLYAGVFCVQGTVNGLGINAMAAYNIVTKIDNFALLPGDSLASSLSTFVAQNKGAGKDNRITSGLKYAIWIGLAFCGLLAVLLPFLAHQLMQLFLDSYDEEVIRLGVSYLGIMAFLYPLTAICNTFQGFYRGLGQLRVTLIATLIQIPIRVLLALLLVDTWQLDAMPIATGIGWLCMIAYEVFVYFHYRKKVVAYALV